MNFGIREQAEVERKVARIAPSVGQSVSSMRVVLKSFRKLFGKMNSMKWEISGNRITYCRCIQEDELRAQLENGLLRGVIQKLISTTSVNTFKYKKFSNYYGYRGLIEHLYSDTSIRLKFHLGAPQVHWAFVNKSSRQQFRHCFTWKWRKIVLKI